MRLVSRARGSQDHRQPRSRDEWTHQVATYFSGSSAYWDDVYSGQDVKAQVYRNRMAVAGRWAAPDGPGAIAADIGAGAGHFAVLLARRGLRVTAIDASEAMLARVARNAHQAKVADLVVLLTSDAQRLELTSATCDLVTAIGLLSWVGRPELAVAEMARVAKPGGRVIVTMDNSLSLARWLDPGWHVSVRALIHRIRRLVARHPLPELPVQLPVPMTRREFSELLEQAGLEPLEFEAVGFGPFTFLGRTVLPNWIGLRVDRLLQRLADGAMPWLKRAAIFHVALAAKPAGHDAPATEAPATEAPAP